MSTTLQQGRGVIARYREYLPINDSTPIISLGEGNTPLLFSVRLSERVGRDCEVFVKNEGVNPTGSFKDRGMTVAVSKAIERKARSLICASTGNTSASAAAYAARAGIPCVVVLPAGKIARGKLLQAFAYGAKIVAVEGNFDDALRIVPPSRLLIFWAMRPICICCRLVTREISPRIGPAIANSERKKDRQSYRP
jgi:threonine synthase